MEGDILFVISLCYGWLNGINNDLSYIDRKLKLYMNFDNLIVAGA